MDGRVDIPPCPTLRHHMVPGPLERLRPELISGRFTEQFNDWTQRGTKAQKFVSDLPALDVIISGVFEEVSPEFSDGVSPICLLRYCREFLREFPVIRQPSPQEPVIGILRFGTAPSA